MLSSIYRFHGHGSLRYVYRNGTAIRSHLITVKYSKNPHRKTSRFAVVVSKKVHKGAVGRNRMRRRIYEIVRAELPHITSIYDVAIMVFSSEVMTMPDVELKQTIKQLFTQADFYK
jgi:ribonuclease P protein component